MISKVLVVGDNHEPIKASTSADAIPSLNDSHTHIRKTRRARLTNILKRSRSSE